MRDAATEDRAKRNFILQQGLAEPTEESCSPLHSALMFQPRLVGLLVVVCILLRSPWPFLALGAVLWWSALLPDRNPFDALYNATLGRRHDRPRLRPARPPRRFSQGLAGTFNLAVGVLLLLGHYQTARIVQVLLLAAVAALVLGSFCLGSFLQHLLRGRFRFAVRTLPWSR